MAAGIFDLHNGGTTPTTSVVNLKGNFTLAGSSTMKQTTVQSGSTVNFNFTGTGTQVVTISTSATISSQATRSTCAIQFGVASGATIDMGTSVLKGANNTSFTLSAGASIKTAHTEGLTLSGLTGSIQVNGPRSYSSTANYTYNSTVAGQMTGNGLTAANNLIISNTTASGATFSNSIAVSGNMSVITAAHVNLGTFASSAASLTLGGNPQTSGTSYGGDTSPAANKPTTYFNTATGILNVSLVAPSNLSYNSPFAFPLSETITQKDPTVTGSVTSWAILPALPTGLDFNTSTGAITGTPTINSPSTVYTVTATNTAGSTTCQIVISVGNYRYAVASAAWNVTFTWAATSGGIPGATVPTSGDIVFIGEALTRTVTIPSSYVATAGSLTMGNYSGATVATLTFTDGTSSLAVSNDLVMNRPNATATSEINVNAGSLTIGGALKLAFSDLTPDASTSLINRLNISTGTVTTHDLLFNGQSAAQSQIVFNGAGTLNISGNLTFGYILGILTPSTGTVNFNGTTAAQTIPVGVSSVTYNNLTINNTYSGGAILGAAISGTNVTGNLSVGNINTGSTFDNGGYAISLASAKSLSVANGCTFNLAGTKTMTASTTTVAGNFSMSGTASATALAAINTAGNFNLGSGTTFNGSSFTHTIGGNWTNDGTFTPSTSTISFTGTTAAQTLGGTGTNTFNNLIINNTYSSGGVKAGSNITVNGVLNLAAVNPSATATTGSLQMYTNWHSYPSTGNATVGSFDSYTLYMGSSATTSGNGDVTGIVTRNTIAASTAYSFGNQFTTVSITPGTSPTLPTSITVIIKIGVAPGGFTGAVQRCYQVLPNGGANCFVIANFHYLDTELNGNAEAQLVTWDYDLDGVSSSPDEHGRSAYDFTNNYVGLSNVPINYFLYVDPGHAWRTIFELADHASTKYLTWRGGTSSDWTNGSNWQPPGNAPDGTCFVIIPDAGTTSNDPVLPATATVNTLTIESGGVLSMGNSILTIANSLSAGWEDQNPAGNPPGTSTVIFANAGATVSGTGRFYNLTINSGASLTNAAGSTVKIENEVTKTGSWYCDVSDNTVEYSKAGTQTIVIPTDNSYHSLTLSGSGTKDLPALTKIHGNLTLSGTVITGTSSAQTIGGDFTLGIGTTFTAGAYTHNIGGNFTNNGGTFTNTGSTINLNGAAEQTIGGSSSTTFNNLSMNNASGATLGIGETVDGTLNLTSGLITTGTFTLTAGCSGTISNASTSSYVNGKLARIYCSTGSKEFPIGKGGNYRNLTLNYSALTGTSTVTAEQFESTIAGSIPANTTVQAGRYWALSQTGSSSYTYSLTLDGSTFTPGTGTAKILKGNELTNTAIDATFSSPNFTTTGLTQASDFGNFAVGSECTAPVIGTQPSSTSTCDGTGTPTFTVAATGEGLSYQWFESTTGTGGTFNPLSNGGVYSGVTSNTLTITAPPVSMSGYEYKVVVSRDCGSSLASDAVTLTVNALPTITLGASPSVMSGSLTANLTYSAVSGSPDKYSIVYDADATTAGFVNVTNSALTLSPIVLVLPGSIAGTYNGHLYVSKSTTGCVSAGAIGFGYPFTVTIDSHKTSANDGSWYISGNWSPTGVPTLSEDIIVNHNINIDGTPTAVCNNLTINSGKVLTIGAGKALTVNGTLTNDAGLTGLVLASSADGTGSLIASTSGFDITVQRYMSNNRWHLISSPVAGQSAATFLLYANGNSIAWDNTGLVYGFSDYDEATNTWNTYFSKDRATSEGDFTSGKGYEVRRWGSDNYGNVVFKGQTVTPFGNYPIAKTTNGKGWHCVGNPFTSALNINAGAGSFLAENSGALHTSYGAVYVWSEGDSYIFDGLKNQYYYAITNSGFLLGTPTGLQSGDSYVQSSQGFLVCSNTANATLTFTSAMQSHQPALTFKSTKTSWPGIRLIAATKDAESFTDVTFYHGMTKGLDPTYDAGLLRNNSKIDLYTRLIEDNGIDFRLQCLPDNEYANLVIPIGLDCKAGGTVTFSAKLVELPGDCKPYLEDKLTGVVTDFSVETARYTATLAPDSKGIGRFYLYTSKIGTGIPETETSPLLIYSVNREIHIEGLVGANATGHLYDLSGKSIGSYRLQPSTVNIINEKQVTAGAYLFVVQDGEKRFSKKLVLN